MTLLLEPATRQQESQHVANFFATMVPQQQLERLGETLDAGAEPRQLARYGVTMKHTRAHAAMHLRLRDLKCVDCNFLVAALDRGLDLLDEAAHPRDTRAVDRRAALGLTYGFLSRLVVGHR